MPGYYCNYCDTYLHDDSPSVRKTHCTGRAHRANVELYYQTWMGDQVQYLNNIYTPVFEAGQIANNPIAQPDKESVAISPPAQLMGQHPGGPPQGPGMMPLGAMGPGGHMPPMVMVPHGPMPPMMGMTPPMMVMRPPMMVMMPPMMVMMPMGPMVPVSPPIAPPK